MEIKWERTSFKVMEWLHQKDIQKTVGMIQKEHHPQYDLKFTAYNPTEPDIYYIGITVSKGIELSNGIFTFKGVTESVYKFNIPRDKTPLPSLIFLFVEKATYDFAVEYTQRVAGTALQFHKIPIPQLAVMEKDIEDGIVDWDKNVRYIQMN